jgi:hypothetical protein
MEKLISHEQLLLGGGKVHSDLAVANPAHLPVNPAAIE